jgi:hypothetical protein
VAQIIDWRVGVELVLPSSLRLDSSFRRRPRRSGPASEPHQARQGEWPRARIPRVRGSAVIWRLLPSTCCPCPCCGVSWLTSAHPSVPYVCTVYRRESPGQAGRCHDHARRSRIRPLPVCSWCMPCVGCSNSPLSSVSMPRSVWRHGDILEGTKRRKRGSLAPKKTGTRSIHCLSRIVGIMGSDHPCSQ